MHPNQGHVTKLFAVDPLSLLAYLTVSSTHPVTGRLLGNGKQMYIHLCMYMCTYMYFCWKLLGNLYGRTYVPIVAIYCSPVTPQIGGKNSVYTDWHV